VGFNLDFAPVMDVVAPDAPLDSTVIGDRSYGDDPVVVAELGGLVIMTLRSLGIIPCSKHFPGHGGTLVDSHVELPVDNRDYAAIEARDLYPFKKAIEGSVEMIMTAHALFPSIDTRAPATVSSRTLSGLLRKELGFKGVIATDDLDMGAITRELSPEEAGLMAFKAGADLLLVCNEPSKAFIMREALLKALDKGEFEPSRIHESLDRLEKLRQRYRDSMNPCDVGEAQRKFAS
jgi:beta-N-acetylhexosaminidase